ncbi:amino acid transporter [Genlisea aurea]|uniref:Amino acid transporter n=1 Tax=Genlisea aurea TaxID=192259 RepID=S8CJS6_9LAMI|nr:amino acid transporter [Genlisea aurea]
MKLESDDSGVEASLLPQIQSSRDERRYPGASFSGAIFNISTGMVGAGIMSIPATFNVLGVIPSFLVILAVAYLVEVTVEFMLKHTHYGNSTTYGELMAESFGRFGSVSLQLCVMITNIGALIIYLIIIGDVLSGNESGGTVHLGILQQWFGIQWWNSRPFALLVVVLFFLLPLLLLRRIDSLRHASTVSVLLAAFFVVICAAMVVNAMLEGETTRIRLVPDLTDGTASVFKLFTTVPVIATAFGCHVNIHPVRAELDRPSEMISAVRISLVLCVVIYVLVGIFGYLLFGDSIMADMLVNFDRTWDSLFATVLDDMVRISYAVHLMLVFPVMNYSLRINVDELFFPKKPLRASGWFRFYALTSVLLGFVYSAAIAVPNVWYFFQFMGTTTVMCIMFIFPASIVLRSILIVKYRYSMHDETL